MEIKNDGGYKIATEAQVQDNKNSSYNIGYFAKEAGTCQTSVMVNGEHVSCNPFTVQVNPRQYKAVLSFGGEGSSAGMFDESWGVAVNEDGETYLRSFGRNGDQEGKFNYPRGLAYLSNGNFAVSDT